MLMSDSIRPPRSWTANLDQSVDNDKDAGGGSMLDPIERDALDSAVPFAAEHARRYIATAGEDDGWEGPRPILLLYTIGRKSGAVRRNPLLYFEFEDQIHIIGSKGGSAEHPLWFRNLVAQPSVHIRVRDRFMVARAEVLRAIDRAVVWPHLIERYPMFGDYQQHTEREIPLVRLRTGYTA